MIKDLHMKCLTPKKIKTGWIMFIAHLHQRLRLYSIEWMNLNVVVHPHTSRSWRPIAKPEIIDKVHDIVLTDRRVHELIEATGISHGTVISILHKQLDMKKLSARWVSRLLTVDHNRDDFKTMFGDVSIQMNFCVDLLLWTKHESITSHPRRRNSQNNGLHQVNQLRKRRRP